MVTVEPRLRLDGCVDLYGLAELAGERDTFEQELVLLGEAEADAIQLADFVYEGVALDRRMAGRLELSE